MGGVTATVIFDAGGMPVEVDLGTNDPQDKLHFEIGSFEIGKPPGW